MRSHPAIPALGSIIAILCTHVGVAAAGAPIRPNVLLIVTDDQRIGSLRVMPRTRSWLMDGGVTFNHAYVTTPLCCPSRASIFSGRYAHNHGVWFNSRKGWGRFRQRSTIQHHLQRSGYRTAIVGKYFNAWEIADDPPWFDRWWIYSPGFRDSGGYFDTRWNANGRIITPSRYSTDYIADTTLGVVRKAERHDRRPWLLVVAPFAPHQPATPAPRDATASVPAFRPNPAVRERDLSDKPPYARTSELTLEQTLRLRTSQLRSLMAVDDLIGRTMRTLRKRNELRRTLVIYISDNGFFWEEHGLEEKGPPYLQGVRVPMMVRWSGHLAAGAVDGRRAANIDIAPTVMEAAGVTIPERFPMDGRSLLQPWDRRQVLTEFRRVRVSRAPTWAALRTRRYHYVEYYRAGRVSFREYYRLRTDPWELVNLLHDGRPGNDPDVAPLHRRLATLRGCVGSACP